MSCILGGLAALAGCGSNGAPLPVAKDLGNFIVADASEQPTPDLAKACAPSCTSDSDCQNSCPATNQGTACCDTQTNTCFPTTASVCPVAIDMTVPSQY
ncbi:MAG: hypothetical protein ABI321_02420 [Polyangia bacterium]